jgi:hypothetical protein
MFIYLTGTGDSPFDQTLGSKVDPYQLHPLSSRSDHENGHQLNNEQPVEDN